MSRAYRVSIHGDEMLGKYHFNIQVSIFSSLFHTVVLDDDNDGALIRKDENSSFSWIKSFKCSMWRGQLNDNCFNDELNKETRNQMDQ